MISPSLIRPCIMVEDLGGGLIHRRFHDPDYERRRPSHPAANYQHREFRRED